MGGLITVKSPSAYELLPFVDSGQVKLYLSVTLTSSDQTDDGSNRLKLLFEVRNDSQVPIYSAMVTESDYFKGIVNEYPTLAAGTTSFEKEFIVPAGTRSLTFVLTAVDPAQTQYASVPITLDLSPLAAPRPTNPPAIKPGKTVDTTGTIYDTERYTRILRMASLIVLALTLVFLLLSVIFRVAELNTRRLLPKETGIWNERIAYLLYGMRNLLLNPRNRFKYPLQPPSALYLSRPGPPAPPGVLERSQPYPFTRRRSGSS